MKHKNIILALVLILLTATVTASDYIIEDSNGNNLFVVNETGEKQIQNGKLYLNGNSVTDNSGPLTLEGGDVEIPNSGGLYFDNGTYNAIYNIEQVAPEKGRNLHLNTPSDGSGNVKLYDSANTQPILVGKPGGKVSIPNGNLDMNNNEIQNVGALNLGWDNLTNYPNGCSTDEAVRVIGDTLDCVSLNPGGTVETGGGAAGQAAFFIDSENITGSENFYWNNSEAQLGIGTNNPSSKLDVNGNAELNGLDMDGSSINSIGNLQGSNIVNSDQINSGAVGSSELGSSSVGASELDSAVSGSGLSGGSGSALSVNTGTGLTVNSDNLNIDTSVVPRKNIDETITANQWTYENNVQIRGSLDVWGTVQNTDVSNLNINGSLLPPSGYSDTFDVGSSSRRWRTGYFQDIALGNNAIDNSEITNTDVTVNANSGLSGGGTANLGGSTGLSHEDTSTQSNIDNSGGTIIQDLTIDGYGHITGQNSYNLDNRYYTESQSDSKFVDESGDTINGELSINNSKLRVNTEAPNDVLRIDNTGSETSTDEMTVRFDDAPLRFWGYSSSAGSGSPTLALNHDDHEVEIPTGNLNMNSNSIINFFGSNCESDEVVESVNADGTYNCQSITGAADDTYVNEGGDTMSGNLDMSGNNIQNVGTLNASTIQRNGNNIDSLYVDESGDSMSGSLNLQGNHVDGINYLDLNSEGQIQTDSTDAIRIDSNQNVEIANGALQLNQGDLKLPNGDLNISSTGEEIAEFSDTGITLSQPLSVESSGPLSVSNGIDLTDSSTNTIESYSTMYLSTSSGSPSDIVLEPTGEVGIDSNASITGNLDMQNGRIKNLQNPSNSQDAATKDYVDTNVGDGSCSGNNVFLDGNGNCRDLTNNYGNVIHGDLIQDNQIDNSEIENSGSFTFNGITNNGDLNFGNSNNIQSSGTDAIRFDGSQNVEVPNGNLLGSNGEINFGSGNFDLVPASGTQGVLITNGNHWRVWDDSNSQPIADFNEGGEVEIANGHLDMSSNDIRNLESPDAGNDAATKDYVDNQTGDAESSATQNLNQVLSEGNDAGSQAITSIGSGNIDIDGSGRGNIQLNNEEVRGGSITQSSNLVAGSYSTGESSVDGGDVWVENDVQVGGDVVGSGADVAEKINNESKMEPGTVVTISGNMSVDKTDERHDTEAAGVVSTDPAMIMAKERDGVPVAMTGTVPVKVSMENGEITPGDMLTTSSESGTAMKCSDLDECTGSIIGKALEPAQKSGKIDMLISMS